MGNTIAIAFELLDLEGILAAIDPVPGPGIYFLLQGVDVVYIGQSESMRTRVWTHRGERIIVFESSRFLPFPLEDLDVMEALYIRHYRPIGNRGVLYGARRHRAARPRPERSPSPGG